MHTRRSFTASTLAIGAAAATLPGLARADTGAVQTAMDAFVARGEVPGYSAAVWRDGAVSAAVGGRLAVDGAPVATDSLFRAASISKPVTAAAAMKLVEQGRLDLDGPVSRWLPELGEMKVLPRLEAPLDEAAPAVRPITLRHLLTMTFGSGAIMVWPPQHPIQMAMQEAGLAAGYELPQLSSDEYLKRLSSLPLAAQPGDAFFYHMGMDVAGLAIARATDQSLGEALQDLIFAPLGMNDTGFTVTDTTAPRLATHYAPDPQTGALSPLTGPTFTARAPVFEAGGGGLVTTAPDFLTFLRMLLAGGRADGGDRLLSEASVKAMATNALSAAQLASPHAGMVLGAHTTWGLGGAVELGGGALGLEAGAFGWHGGYGTTAYVEPGRNLAAVLLTNRALASPEPPESFIAFWNTVHRG